jgi:hypothetical protein
MNDLSNKNVKNKIGYHREVDITIRGYFSYILDITFIGEGNQSTQRKLQAPLQDTSKLEAMIGNQACNFSDGIK